MKTDLKYSITLFASIWCFSAVAIAAELPLSKLDLSHMEIGWGQPKAGKSVDGKPLKIGNQSYTDGIDTHAESKFLAVI